MKADDIIFDTQEKLGTCWKEAYPNGKLPDRIGAALYEIIRIYYAELSRVKKGGRPC